MAAAMAGGAGDAVLPLGFDAASFAFTAAIRAAASCFLRSKSDMPALFAGGGGAGEPSLERMRFESESSPSEGSGRLFE